MIKSDHNYRNHEHDRCDQNDQTEWNYQIDRNDRSDQNDLTKWNDKSDRNDQMVTGIKMINMIEIIVTIKMGSYVIKVINMIKAI